VEHYKVRVTERWIVKGVKERDRGLFSSSVITYARRKWKPRNQLWRFIGTDTCTARWVITTVHRLPNEIQSIHCGMSCYKPVSLPRREQWSTERTQMQSSVFLISNCTRLLSEQSYPHTAEDTAISTEPK